MQISRGQRLSLGDFISNPTAFSIGLKIDSPGITIDYTIFGLDPAGKLSDDRYAVFYNQPQSPCGSIRLLPASAGDQAGFDLDLNRLPPAIDRLIVAASIDGSGTMGQINSGHLRFLTSGREAAAFPIQRKDYNGERAVILGEVYRKNGAWRFSATGQGFNGGLDALVRHFGGEVNDTSASTPVPPTAPPVRPAPITPPLPPTRPVTPPPPPPAPARISLEKKIEKEAPHLISLAKKATISLEKKKLTDTICRVGLVLDASGSMYQQYAEGKVQAVVDRILPLAVHFDDDGQLDTWAFAEKSKELHTVTTKNVKDYVEREWRGWNHWMKALNYNINYEPAVMRDVIAKYKPGLFSRDVLPAYVIFISDGGVGSDREIEKLLVESSKLPIFWQFVGIGGSDYGILEEFDSMRGRKVDNCNFFALDDLYEISDQELYDRLLNEFPSWLREAKGAGIIK